MKKSVLAIAIISFVGILICCCIQPTPEPFYDGLWTVTTKDGKTYYHMRIRTAKMPGLEAQALGGKVIYIRDFFKLEKE